MGTKKTSTILPYHDENVQWTVKPRQTSKRYLCPVWGQKPISPEVGGAAVERREKSRKNEVRRRRFPTDNSNEGSNRNFTDPNALCRRGGLKTKLLERAWGNKNLLPGGS